MKLAILVLVLAALAWLANRARLSPSLADRLPIPEHFDDRDWLSLYERAA